VKYIVSIITITTLLIISSLIIMNTNNIFMKNNRSYTNTPMNSLNYSKILFNKTYILRNSYYMLYKLIYQGPNMDYKYSYVRDYIIANIDGDKYPDFILWIPRKIIVWSYSRGVIASYTSNMFINRPIVMDFNNDGLDDVLIVENNYVDAAIKSAREIGRVKSVIRLWFVRNNTIETLAVISKASVRSGTYHIYGNYLYIPWILNYYYRIGYIYKTYVSRIGVVRINLNNYHVDTYTIKTYRMNKIYDPGPTPWPPTNDYTTNYELFLIGNNTLFYLIPSGLDKIIMCRINKFMQPEFIKEISIGDQSFRDRLVTILYNYPSFPTAAYTFKERVWEDNYWRAPQRLGSEILGNKILLPYTSFPYLNPLDSEGGVYFRVERINGFLIINPYNDSVEKVILRGRIIDDLKITSITSILFKGYRVLFGGLGAIDTRDYIFIGYYDLKTGKTHILWMKNLSPLYAPLHEVFEVTLGGDNVSATLYGLIIINKLAQIHVIPQSSLEQPFYTNDPPTTLKPGIIDLDNDGLQEYYTILFYNGYTGYYYGKYLIRGLKPVIMYGKVFLVWFKNPLLRIRIYSLNPANSTIKINISYNATHDSYIVLRIISLDTNNTVDELRIHSGSTSITYSFNKLGKYKLVLDTYTVYKAYDNLVDTSSGVPQRIIYHEEVVIPETIYYRYPSRITILKPKTNILTPNLYNPLKIYFTASYLDIYSNVWKPLIINDTELISGVVNNTLTNTIINKTYINNTLIYIIMFKNTFIPGKTYSIRIVFRGTSIYGNNQTMITYKMIKYPVKLVLKTITKTPALTSLNISVRHYYEYMDINGYWHNKTLSSGGLKLTIYNKTISGNTVVGETITHNIVDDNTYQVGNITPVYSIIENITSSETLFRINKYKILPGEYIVSVKYIPINNYYGVDIINESITIHKLLFNAWINTSTIMPSDPLLLVINESTSNADYRVMSVPVKLYILNINNTMVYSEIISNNTNTTRHVLRLDKTLTPGNYTLVLEPAKYRYAYIPTARRYELVIISPNIHAWIEAKPLLKINTYLRNGSYYALTPIMLKPVITSNIYPGNIVKHVVIIVENKTYYLKYGEYITWYPILPGYKRIIIRVSTIYGLTIRNTTYITIYPMKTRINAKHAGDKIRIEVLDLYNRYAVGELTVKIYSRYKLLKEISVSTNGTTIIDPRLGKGIYWIYIYYTGNASYTDSDKYITIIINNYQLVEPMPEPPSLVFIMFLLMITYVLLRNKQRIMRT
jgi:hypothetical protein